MEDPSLMWSIILSNVYLLFNGTDLHPIATNNKPNSHVNIFPAATTSKTLISNIWRKFIKMKTTMETSVKYGDWSYWMSHKLNDPENVGPHKKFYKYVFNWTLMPCTLLDTIICSLSPNFWHNLMMRNVKCKQIVL